MVNGGDRPARRSYAGLDVRRAVREAKANEHHKSMLRSSCAGLMEFLDSGTPYGAAGTVDTRPYVPNPGYVNPPATVNYFFTPRDAFRTDMATHTDIAIVYGHKLGFAGKTELFVRATFVNVFNQSGISNAGAVDQSVLTASNSSQLKPFNPFTTTPVQGVNWDYGPNFGRPLTRLAYQTPRTTGISLGFRF